MRSAVALLALSLLLPGTRSSAADEAVVRVAATAALSSEARALLETQAAAWNRGDLEAFCSVYADDALFATAGGLTKGRAEVLARYKARYPDAAARGTLSFEVLAVDLLAPGTKQGEPESIAVVARWKISWPEKPTAAGLTLLNLVKAPGGWRIVHDASM
jgi:uncharacterized protein (TIGR02246 family)